MKIQIEQKRTEAINWSVPQIVISDYGEIVITTGEHEDDTFEGFGCNKKRFLIHRTKRLFKKFNGKITLSNE